MRKKANPKTRSEKNSPYERYREINERLMNGELVYLDKEKASHNDSPYLFHENPGVIPLHTPKLAVYVGSGASHSWLWFVEILENMGFEDIVFLDEEDMPKGVNDRDAFLVSGGETFALAHGLGEKGRDAIIRLLKRGGLYLGSCAGACMMMRSTSEPLGLFDLVNIQIANIVDELPEQIKPSNKFSTPYGCAFVFHPVREEVVLKSAGISPMYLNGSFTAPLYGGPPMEESDEVISLAEYSGFTSKTDYLTTPQKAEETLIGKTAVCMKKIENGHIILSGPHLEHPRFPQANAMVADAIFYSLSSSYERSMENEESHRLNKAMLTELKREISNIRIVAFALERTSISWLIGRKYYEPEKIRTYVEALWKRILILERSKDIGLSADSALLESAVSHSKESTGIIRKLKILVDKNEPSDHIATELFQHLRPLSKDFFTYYFSKKPRLSDPQD